MKCRRCLKNDDTQYRVHSDAIDMKVCGSCAEKARELGIVVEVLDLGERRKSGSKRADKNRPRSHNF